MAHTLYERFRHLIHEGAKFLVIGIVGVIAYNLIVNGMHYGLGLGALTSVTIAVVLTTVMSYLGNRYWSFRHRERTTVHRETVLFFLLNGIGLLIQLACVGLTYHGLGLTSKLDYAVANNAGIVIGTAFRFWSYRKWVWAARREVPSVAESLAGAEGLEPALAGRASPRPANREAAGPAS